MPVANRKKVALYCSQCLYAVRETGGVRRFKELLAALPAYCSLTLLSGDEDRLCPASVAHIRSGADVDCRSELKLWLKNRRAIRQLKRQAFDNVLVFDVPPMLGLVLSGVRNICLLVRKDLIGYTDIQMTDAGAPRAKKKLRLWAYARCEGLCLLRAQRVIVQCDYDRRKLLERHPALRASLQKKIRVQINNVNPSWTARSGGAEQRAQAQGERVFTVGCVNDFTNTRKGCLLFLEAVAGLLDEGVALRARIAGDGRLLEDCRRQYAAHPAIEFVGRVRDPVAFLADCDLAVVPSYADSCPNSAMEALYAGTPVIGSNAGGIPEILGNPEALFAPEVQALREAIRDYASPRRRTELERQQRERREELTFDWAEEIYKLLP